MDDLELGIGASFWTKTVYFKIGHTSNDYFKIRPNIRMKNITYRDGSVFLDGNRVGTVDGNTVTLRGENYHLRLGPDDSRCDFPSENLVEQEGNPLIRFASPGSIGTAVICSCDEVGVPPMAHARRRLVHFLLFRQSLISQSEQLFSELTQETEKLPNDRFQKALRKLKRGNALEQLLLAIAFGRAGAEVVPLLEPLLRRRAVQGLREAVLHILSRIGPDAAPAIPSIVRLAGNDREGRLVRAKAFDALGNIGQVTEQVVKVLRKSRRYPNIHIRDAVDAAAQKLGVSLD